MPPAVSVPVAASAPPAASADTGYAQRMAPVVFPADFLWGAATAAHQVEGDNVTSDWWAWERRPDTPCREPSGIACDHYRRYADDIALLASTGLNTYRFSVEWARIEPSDGTFDPAAIDHYRRVVETVRAHGLVPMVTLHHFTLPAWLADRGGWRAPETPARFERYVRRVVAEIGSGVDWFCTINEPGVVAFGGYLGALGFPPGTRDVASWKEAIRGLVEGHRRAREAVRELRPTARAGATHSMQEWEADPGGRPVMEYLRRMNEDVFLEACADDDFIGVQTYTRVRVRLPAVLGPLARLALAIPATESTLVPLTVRRETRQASVQAAGSPRGRGSAGVAAALGQDGERLTQMGYEFRPQAIAATVRRAAALHPGKPIVVTEHGIATADDRERVAFIRQGLAALHAAMADGVPLRGYVHWSLLDNFEWARGYEMTFGLVAVDRATQARTVRPSAYLLGQIARTGRLEP